MNGWLAFMVQFIVTWLVLWAMLLAGYILLEVATDALHAQWQRYQRKQQARRATAAELARLDREAIASIQRIEVAFLAAQRLVREQADRDLGPTERSP